MYQHVSREWWMEESPHPDNVILRGFLAESIPFQWARIQWNPSPSGFVISSFARKTFWKTEGRRMANGMNLWGEVIRMVRPMFHPTLQKWNDDFWGWTNQTRWNTFEGWPDFGERFCQQNWWDLILPRRFAFQGFIVCPCFFFQNILLFFFHDAPMVLHVFLECFHLRCHAIEAVFQKLRWRDVHLEALSPVIQELAQKVRDRVGCAWVWLEGRCPTPSYHTFDLELPEDQRHQSMFHMRAAQKHCFKLQPLRWFGKQGKLFTWLSSVCYWLVDFRVQVISCQHFICLHLLKRSATGKDLLLFTHDSRLSFNVPTLII